MIRTLLIGLAFFIFILSFNPLTYAFDCSQILLKSNEFSDEERAKLNIALDLMFRKELLPTVAGIKPVSCFSVPKINDLPSKSFVLLIEKALRFKILKPDTLAWSFHLKSSIWSSYDDKNGRTIHAQTSDEDSLRPMHRICAYNKKLLEPTLKENSVDTGTLSAVDFSINHFTKLFEDSAEIDYPFLSKRKITDSEHILNGILFGYPKQDVKTWIQRLNGQSSKSSTLLHLNPYESSTTRFYSKFRSGAFETFSGQFSETNRNLQSRVANAIVQYVSLRRSGVDPINICNGF